MKKKILILIIVFICVGCGCTMEKEKNDKIDSVAKIEDGKISLTTYNNLEFKSIYGEEQINVNVQNVSETKIVINKIIIKVYDKSGRVNNYEFTLNETLENKGTTNFTFAYKIEDIKKIEYLYEQKKSNFKHLVLKLLFFIGDIKGYTIEFI